MSDKPVVLFACIHNSGRSVAARILTVGGVRTSASFWPEAGRGRYPKLDGGIGARNARLRAARWFSFSGLTCSSWSCFSTADRRSRYRPLAGSLS